MRHRTLFCFLLASSTAAAQRDTASAQAMFDQARDAMKRGEFAKACPKFAESQRLDPQPGTLANLAICEEKNGTIASAWTHARDATEQLGAGDERVPALRALVARVEKRLPRLVVRLASDAPKGTKITRDGIELGAASLGEPLPVDPGPHTIMAAAAGRKTTTTTVNIAEGATKDLEVAPGEPDTSTPSGSPSSVGPVGSAPATTEGSSRKTIGYVVGGVGVIGAGVALITGVVLAGKQSTVKASCDTTTKVCAGPDTQAARDAASSGQSLLPVYYGGLVVGLVGLGAGAYFLLSSDTDASTAVRVGPGSVALQGRF